MMLEKFINNLEAVLLPKEKYKPFPEACDRAAWEALSDMAKRKYILAGDKGLEYGWACFKGSTVHGL